MDRMVNSSKSPGIIWWSEKMSDEKEIQLKETHKKEVRSWLMTDCSGFDWRTEITILRNLQNKPDKTARCGGTSIRTLLTAQPVMWFSFGSKFAVTWGIQTAGVQRNVYTSTLHPKSPKFTFFTYLTTSLETRNSATQVLMLQSYSWFCRFWKVRLLVGLLPRWGEPTCREKNMIHHNAWNELRT